MNKWIHDNDATERIIILPGICTDTNNSYFGKNIPTTYNIIREKNRKFSIESVKALTFGAGKNILSPVFVLCET